MNNEVTVIETPSTYLFETADWSFPLLDKVMTECEIIGRDELKLTWYPVQVEIVDSAEMLNLYSKHGLSQMYDHWSFGKDLIQNTRMYRQGMMGLAFEIIQNTCPSIAYLMDTNTMTMQALVLAHACVSGRTEYLSPTGWKRIDQYDGGLVAQFHRDGRATFVKPSAYIKNPTTDFLHIDGNRTEQEITTNHRVIFVNGNNNIVEITGEELKRRHEEKTRGFGSGRFITGFNMDSKTELPLSMAEIRLHIAVKADGSFVPRRESEHFNCVDHQRIRFHLKKKRKIKRLEGLLKSMGIDYKKKSTYEGRYSITFNYPENISKRFDAEWYAASPDQLKLIAEEVMYWDGSEASSNFSSAFKGDVDYVQYVWASVGRHTRIRRGTRCWAVTFSDNPLVSIGGGRHKTEIPTVKSEDGMSYCFTVDSGMFVTRLNDKICVTGNSIGHNSFFKNNYLFKEGSDASSILDYIAFAKRYITECEEKHGYETVEELLDCCHSLQMHGVDKYTRPPTISASREKELQKERQETIQKEINVLWSTLPTFVKGATAVVEKPFVEEPEENLLHFLEKYSPVLEPWEREIIRIVRTIGQYFYPNFQTKIINEGWACFVHYHIMTRLWEKKMLTDGSYIEFLKDHTSVCFQPTYNEVRYNKNGFPFPIYSGINPYALGFEMFMDIKRICQEPTEEDKKWFPDIAGTDWVVTCRYVMENFRDESFIGQFLSPHLIRKWRLFFFKDDGPEEEFLEVMKIHNDQGYEEIRRTLARLYDFNTQVPNIAVTHVEMKGNRKLVLTHTTHDGILMSKSSVDALANFGVLWGFDVTMESKDFATEKLMSVIEIKMSQGAP